jgi:hypothetical protein
VLVVVRSRHVVLLVLHIGGLGRMAELKITVFREIVNYTSIFHLFSHGQSIERHASFRDGRTLLI